MKWATRELIHFDRIASAWLILRFVDPDATFAYLKKDEPVDDDVNLFGVPGARLAMHDGQSTTFQRILCAYSISDAALDQLSRIIAAGVNHVMHDAAQSDISKRESLAGGALALTEGIFLLSASDEECLDADFRHHGNAAVAVPDRFQLQSVSIRGGRLAVRNRNVVHDLRHARHLLGNIRGISFLKSCVDLR
jgi:hypothetical protein